MSGLNRVHGVKNNYPITQLRKTSLQTGFGWLNIGLMMACYHIYDGVLKRASKV